MSDAPRTHDTSAGNCVQGSGMGFGPATSHICLTCEDDSRRRLAGLEVQPEPVQTELPSSHDIAMEELTRRRDFGYEKYQSLLTAGNGRNSIQDAIDETADQFVYLITERSEREELAKAYDDVVQGEIEGGYAPVDFDSALGNLFAVVGRYLGIKDPTPNAGLFQQMTEETKAWSEGRNRA